MAHRLRVFATLPEDTSSVPSAQSGSPPLNSSSREYNTHFWPPMTPPPKQVTHTGPHKEKLKINLFFKRGILKGSIKKLKSNLNIWSGVCDGWARKKDRRLTDIQRPNDKAPPDSTGPADKVGYDWRTSTCSQLKTRDQYWGTAVFVFSARDHDLTMPGLPHEATWVNRNMGRQLK